MKEKELESYNDFKQRAYLESRVTDILNYNVNNDSILLALRVAENDMCKQLTSTLNYLLTSSIIYKIAARTRTKESFSIPFFKAIRSIFLKLSS